MSFIAGTTAPGGKIPEDVNQLTVGEDGAAGVGIFGPSTVGGTDRNRAVVTADGLLVLSGEITIDTVDVTDVNIVGTASPAGTGTSHHLVVDAAGAAAVNVTGTVGLSDEELRAAPVETTTAATPWDVVANRQTDEGTLSWGPDTRSVSITVVTGNPVWGSATLEPGMTVGATTDFPGDTFYFPDLVCADGDDVVTVAVVPD